MVDNARAARRMLAIIDDRSMYSRAAFLSALDLERILARLSAVDPVAQTLSRPFQVQS